MSARPGPAAFVGAEVRRWGRVGRMSKDTVPHRFNQKRTGWPTALTIRQGGSAFRVVAPSEIIACGMWRSSARTALVLRIPDGAFRVGIRHVRRSRFIPSPSHDPSHAQLFSHWRRGIRKCSQLLSHPWELGVRSLKSRRYYLISVVASFRKTITSIHIRLISPLSALTLHLTMNPKLTIRQRDRRRFSRSRSATPATVGMKRHTSGASSISLKQQKKQDFIRKKRKLTATKRWENIHNLAALHQHHTKIAMATERIARGGGQYVEDLPSSSTSPSSIPNEWPFSHVSHDIGAQIELSKQLTTFYPHSSDPIPDRNPSTYPSPRQTQIDFSPSSTLSAAHTLANSYPDLVTPSSRFGPSTTKIGLLCSVSHKSKGGKLQGFDDHTDALLRSSSLVTNLLDSQAARLFYEKHKETWKRSQGSGLHDNSALYAPGVAVFRKDDMVAKIVKEEADAEDDEFELIISAEQDANLVDNRSPSRVSEAQGRFISPYVVNVLAAVPVSASVVHKKRFTLPQERPTVDSEIRSLMRERMARCLRVFEQRGDRAVVLGAFGCGCSSQNSVDMVASLWAELVACQGARFKNVFERIVFAVSGKQHAPFKRAFEMRLFEEQVDLALDSIDADVQ